MTSMGIEDYNTAYDSADSTFEDVGIDTSLDDVIERLLDLYPYGDTVQSNWAHNELERIREPLSMAAADLETDELIAAIKQVSELVEAACREDSVHVADVFSDETILKVADLIENPQAGELVSVLEAIQAEQQASAELQEAARRHQESIAPSRTRLEAIVEYARTEGAGVEAGQDTPEAGRATQVREVAFASGKRPSRAVGQDKSTGMEMTKSIPQAGS